MPSFEEKCVQTGEEKDAESVESDEEGGVGEEVEEDGVETGERDEECIVAVEGLAGEGKWNGDKELAEEQAKVADE